MTAQTFKYIKATTETSLRAEYGGDTIQVNGDSAEVYQIDLLVRHLFRQLDWPADGVEQLCEMGDDGSDNWLKVSDNLYPALSSFLTAAELATVVSSAPAGYSATSRTATKMPSLTKHNIYADGDSLLAGTPGTTSNDYTDTYFYQGMELIPNYADNYKFVSMSLGSSSFDNTVGVSTGYPLQRSTAFNQRIRTLPFTADAKVMYLIGLGSNDLAYDGTVTAEIMLERFAEYCGKLREEFPNIVIIATTVFKRSGNNDNDRGYNDLLRANYIECGADLLLDLDVIFGDLDDSYYVADKIHLTTAGHALAAPASRDIQLEASTMLDAGHTFANRAPTFAVNPSASGTLTVGQTLTATTGVYTGIPRTTASVTYQWVDSSGVDISGATSSTYVLQSSDVDTSSPMCDVTVTNSAGSVTYRTADLGEVVAGADFTTSNDTYHWDFTNPSNTVDATAPTNTYSVVVEKINGVSDLEQATKADQPTVETGDYGGFDGTSDDMAVSDLTGVNNSAAGIYVGMVVKPVGLNSGLIKISGSAALEIYYTSSRKIGVKRSGTWVCYTSAGYSAGSEYVVEVYAEGTAGADGVRIFINGTEVSLGLNNPIGIADFGTITAIEVGVPTGGGGQLNGEIKEIILEMNTLSTSDRESKSNYLNGV